MVKPSYRTDSLCMYHKGYQQALSPSSPWTVADIAWENDLQPLEDAA
jgi:hypothetical protein